MKDKRKGNDINVAWKIMKDGAPFSLTGKDVHIYLKTPFGKREVKDFSVAGNTISWTFYGKDQNHLGKHSLELVINENEVGMISTDYCDFVNLVSCSCLVGGSDEGNITTESIELTTTLEFVAGEGGGSYDDTAIWEAVTKLNEDKVDKVEGLGLSQENFTTEEKEKLSGLENYDDEEIKKELAKKADKSEIPTKMSQLEQDIEIGSDYDDTEIRQEIADLSAEVSELSEKVGNLPSGESDVFVAVKNETTYEEIKAAKEAGKAVICYDTSNAYILAFMSNNAAYFNSHYGSAVYELRCSQGTARWSETIKNTSHELKTLDNGNAQITIAGKTAEVATPQYVENAIQQSGGGASNKWKCVFDGRMEVGTNNIECSTYADGTPLKAEEMIVQVLIDENSTVSSQGYVVIHSTNNQTDSLYGALYFEKSDINGTPQLGEVKFKASPMFMVAEMCESIKPVVAQGSSRLVRLGNKIPPQIYEDITYVKVISNAAIKGTAPLVKIYAR